ncbi:MAG: group II truncated hemoglobin [Lysobacterales bacterium]
MPTNNTAPSPPYGQKDATFQAAGGEEGIRALVDSFYDLMSSKQEYRKIFDWHPDGDSARDKLARFLCGWMGGPRRYHEKYGSISIPRVHAHLAISSTEKQMWIDCMGEALARQPYEVSLKQYLLEQLSVPAEHVRKACEPQL